MDFGEKREVGREILSLSNLLYRKIEYDKKKSGIYDLQYVQGGIIKYIKENPQKDIFPRDIVKRFCLTRSTVAGILQKMEQNGYIEMQSYPGTNVPPFTPDCQESNFFFSILFALNHSIFLLFYLRI